ncbi:hypothetical protein B0H11DRAFT_1811909 [Mycena galericulata]|nr:hypothetical protein B0H11DRAFT_1811909 [Mycena galericulata]
MHRALRILEIVDMVCAQAGAEGLLPLPEGSARDLSALARTCTTLCNPALDVLWRSQDTIVNLLRCMPSDLWEIFPKSAIYGIEDIRLRRAIIQTDWGRAQFYLHRVKSFGMHGFLGSPDFLETLSLGLAGECLFPDLEKFEWYPHPPSLLPHVRLFITPRIKELFIGCIEKVSHLSILSNLATKCPSLTKISIFTQGLATVEDIPTLSMFVRGLTHVESLDLPWLDGTALAHLAALPNVKSLLFRQRLLHPSHSNSLLPGRARKPAGGFPALQRLDFICAALPCAAEPLALGSNSPLVEFYISADAEEPTKSVSREFYATLALHCSHSSLQTIRIGGNDGSQTAPSVDRINMYAVGLEILEPLFSFGNLVRVHLAHPVGFDLDNAAVLAMASAWPRLENLALVTSRDRHMDSCVTLEGIYSFAKHCPNLRTLRMVFDATIVPKLLDHAQTRVAQERLNFMDVASSAIRKPRRISTFLFKIFPGLNRINTLFEDLTYSDDPDVVVDPVIVASHDLWKDVEEALPAFQDD